MQLEAKAGHTTGEVLQHPVAPSATQRCLGVGGFAGRDGQALGDPVFCWNAELSSSAEKSEPFSCWYSNQSAAEVGPICKHPIDQISEATKIPAPLVEQIFHNFLGWPPRDTFAHGWFRGPSLYRGRTHDSSSNAMSDMSSDDEDSNSYSDY